MKKCSFCGHENHADANFCANCGRTFVVKEIRQKLGKTFEILGYVAIGLGILAFIFELVDMIICKNAFIVYVIWLFKYIILAGLGFVYLFAHKVKQKSLSLLMSVALVTHVLIFFSGMPYSAFFTDFAGVLYIGILILFIFLLALIVLPYFREGMTKSLDNIYIYIIAGLIGIVAIANLLYSFIFGFRNFGIIIAFGAFGAFFYYAALTVLFVLPLIDKGIEMVEEQGEAKATAPTPEVVATPSDQKSPADVAADNTDKTEEEASEAIDEPEVVDEP